VKNGYENGYGRGPFSPCFDRENRGLTFWEPIKKWLFGPFIKKLPLFYELAVNGKHYRLIHAAPLELFPAHEQSYRNQFRERKKRYKS